jgi:hypothetical protein
VKQPVIYARVPEALKAAVDSYASLRALTLTAAVNQLLEVGLAHARPVAFEMLDRLASAGPPWCKFTAGPGCTSTDGGRCCWKPAELPTRNPEPPADHRRMPDGQPCKQCGIGWRKHRALADHDFENSV